MSRARWSADDIGCTGPATIPVQPAHAATEVGAEDTPRRLRQRRAYRSDGLDAARGIVLAVLGTAAAGLLVFLIGSAVGSWGGS